MLTSKNVLITELYGTPRIIKTNDLKYRLNKHYRTRTRIQTSNSGKFPSKPGTATILSLQFMGQTLNRNNPFLQSSSATWDKLSLITGIQGENSIIRKKMSEYESFIKEK